MELFVSNSSDIKLLEIGGKFGISGLHAGRIIKKLGFSYKKSFYLCGSKRRKAVKVFIINQRYY